MSEPKVEWTAPLRSEEDVERTYPAAAGWRDYFEAGKVRGDGIWPAHIALVRHRRNGKSPSVTIATARYVPASNE